MLMSFSSFGQVKHIVFNVEGTLVQGIPYRNYNAFTNKDQMISIQDGRTFYYYTYPKITYLLKYLFSKDHLQVHFMTKRSEAWAKKVLTSLTLPAPNSQSLLNFIEKNKANRLITEKDFDNGKFDLKKISSDLKNVIVISSEEDLLSWFQKKNMVFLGKNLYYFENYDHAQKERKEAADDQKGNFPSSQEEFFIEQNKASLIYQILRTAKAYVPNPVSLVDEVRNLKIDRMAFAKKGQLIARYNFQDEVLLFKYNDDMTDVLGCGIFNTAQDRFSEDRAIEECVRVSSIKYSFELDEGTHTVSGCELREEATGALIEIKKDPAECVKKHAANLRFYWAGKTKVSCGQYFGTYFLGQRESSNCKDEHLVKEGSSYKIIYLFEHNGELLEFIPEVMKLNFYDTIGNEIYQKYDSKIIALSLIHWIRVKKGETTERPGDYDFLHDTRIAMAFNYKDFGAIRKSGFLNQHEVGKTGGIYSPNRRANLENGFLNLKMEPYYGSYGSQVHKVRPKYSYLLLDKHRPDMGLTRMYSQYGNVVAIFDESIKRRATFTAGDSLDTNASFQSLYTFWYRSKNTLQLRSGEYWESQIWGEIKVNEVDYFLVNCFEPMTQAAIDDLKSSSIEVYDCKTSYDGSKLYNVTKGKRL